jgi:hypothetical protein
MMSMRRAPYRPLALLLVLITRRGGAAEEPSEHTTRPAGPTTPSPAPNAPPASPLSNVAEGTLRGGAKASLAIGGYAEVFYQYNFNRPSNRITNYRGFDNRHNTFTIANAVLDVLGTIGPVATHVALQIGHTPETYYLAEPFSPGTSAAGTTSAAVWKYLQQAIISWRTPLGQGLLIEGGIFLSPIGPEGMAIKDQWNWSRSDLFFGLHFYHTGLRVSYPLTERWTAALLVCNGWNSVVDNNDEKSLDAQFTYNVPDHLTVNLAYFTGVERPSGAPEGRPWRHLFDAYVAWYARPWLSFLVHGNGGFEPNRFGTSAWGAGALYLRLRPVPWLYLAGRGDFFYERLGRGPLGEAAGIFWPSAWVSSATATVEFRPINNISLRIEYRHDQAAGPTYFRGPVARNLGGEFVANADRQHTLTLGITTWF